MLKVFAEVLLQKFGQKDDLIDQVNVPVVEEMGRMKYAMRILNVDRMMKPIPTDWLTWIGIGQKGVYRNIGTLRMQMMVNENEYQLMPGIIC